MNISLRPSSYVMWSNVNLGSFGVTGVKRSYHQKCYFSFRLHGMVMGLMHIHQVDTLYKSYVSRNSPGFIWGHWGQKVIFTKTALIHPCYIAWHKTHTCVMLSAWDPLPMLWSQMSTWGHVGSLGSECHFH